MCWSKRTTFTTVTLVLLALVAPASAYNIYAGISLGIHQDIPDGSLPDGRLPNDFHIEGYICTENGVMPVLNRHTDGLFTNFNYSLEYVGGCWYRFSADWSLPAGHPGIPYCTTFNLGLLFFVEDENTMISLSGWWTLDGMPVGQIYGGYANGGFSPLTGFDVTPRDGAQLVRIGNGFIPPIITPPPIDPPGPWPIEVQITELDLVSMAPSALPPDWFDQLFEGGAQGSWPWVPVVDPAGNDINEFNPIQMPPDSFFDIFLTIPVGGSGYAPQTPVTIAPSDIFVVRTRRMFINNAGVPDPNMGLWEWHIHEAQGPEACCFPDGSCQDLTPMDCAAFGGMPMGMGTICDTTICSGGELGACCYGDLNYQCVVTDPMNCDLQYQGIWMGPGTDCSDFNYNGIADICEGAVEEGACCYEQPIMCMVTTEDYCIQMLGGDWKGPGTNCADLNYNGIADICEEPHLMGACCYENMLCVITTEQDCLEQYGGDWKGPGTDCSDLNYNGVADICEDPDRMGACCYGMPIVCLVTSQAFCEQNLSGDWKGFGTNCDDLNGNGMADICEPPAFGACCYENMLCAITTEADCIDQFGGAWYGPGTNCSDFNYNGIADICEDPDRMGACCYEQPVMCMVTTQAICEQNLNGDWKGLGTNCDDLNGNGIADICEEPVEEGACCYDPDIMLCVVTTEELCLEQFGGDWKGPGTNCDDLDGNGIADICEIPDLLGACCYGSDEILCVITNAYYCDVLFAGDWKGPGTNCDDLNGNGIADVCEPPPEEGACCYDDFLMLCVVTTEELCLEQYGGDWKGPGTDCSDLNFNGIADICEEPHLLGACCYEVPIMCMVTSHYYCVEMLGGQWMGPGTDCSDLNGNGIADICEPEEGACCYDPDLMLCVVTDEITCLDQYFGDWKGPGTNCDDLDGNGIADICEEPHLLGACCYGDDPILCVITNAYNCDVLFAGDFKGYGTNCDDLNGNGVADICEPPPERGACCYDDMLCVIAYEDVCIDQFGGVWYGPGTNCSDLNYNGVADICEDPERMGACCYEQPVLCMVTTQAYCEQTVNGDWKGFGTNCDDLNGNGIADICEEPVEEGACCFHEGAQILCIITTEELCLEQFNGDWMGLGTTCDDWNGNGVADICEEPTTDYRFEFSLDIGSDTELSDPFVDGDEGFDPGDVYWWQGAPVTPPIVPGGRDGFKDDAFIFGNDIWPDPPDPMVPPATRVPVGQGGPDMYHEFFDLDGHDQLDIPLDEFGLHGEPLEIPIQIGPTMCLHHPEFLAVSFDDDMAPGWPAGDVPVTRPSPAGRSSYGDSGGQDEVFGITVLPMMFPAPIVNMYPIADEITVHQSLMPNPDGNEADDDDVDSLDIVGPEGECMFWYFSPDHEATGLSPTGGPLDPGDIYLVTPMGPRLIVDDVFNLGLPDSTDVDAFEFCWVESSEFGQVLAVLFSVDDDDPLTPLPRDESGGRDPNMIYVSFMTGFHFPALEHPLEDDVDAITIWRDSMEPQPQLCPGDMNCDGVVDFADIDIFVQALGFPGGVGWPYPCPWLNGDCDGDGDVNFGDIDPFVALIGTVCP